MRALVASLVVLLAISVPAESVPEKTDGHSTNLTITIRSNKPEADIDASHKHFAEEIEKVKAIAKSQGVTDYSDLSYRFYSLPHFDYSGGSWFASAILGSDSEISVGNKEPDKSKAINFGYNGTIVFTIASDEQGIKLLKAFADKGYTGSFGTSKEAFGCY